MTKGEMQSKLSRKDIIGVGVIVTFWNGFTTCYFYEDFGNDKGIDRATRHFGKAINSGTVTKAEYIYN